jgi:hypothetical protein
VSTTTNQQFEGSTIEEALEAAVASLGDDLEIIDAQRVRRRGVLGVGRKERFEVTASRKQQQADAFDSVLARMVDRVDKAEHRLGVDPAEGDEAAWWPQADFVLPAAPSRRPARVKSAKVPTRPQPAPPNPADQVSTLDLGSLTARSPAAPDARPAASAVPAPQREQRPAARHAAAPTVLPSCGDEDLVDWSADRLLGIGLPPALVGRIPADDLDTDIEWIAATAKAIGELLETAQTVSGPCELTGHGQDAVIHLIRGACDGFRIGALVIDGVRVPATPMELALAVRAMLRDHR